jgi:hypothetical protein
LGIFELTGDLDAEHRLQLLKENDEEEGRILDSILNINALLGRDDE